MPFGHYRACPRFEDPLARRSFGPHGHTPEPALVKPCSPGRPSVELTWDRDVDQSELTECYASSSERR